MAFAIPTTGIQLNVDFDGDCTDDSPNAFSLSASSPGYGSGVIDQALDTSGLFGGISITDSDPLLGLSGIDQTVWFRFKFVGTSGMEQNNISFHVGTAARFDCGIEISGLNTHFKYRLNIENGMGAQEVDDDSLAIDNDWHSVLYSWTNATSMMRCVVDGVEMFNAEHPDGVDDIIEDYDLTFPTADTGSLTSYLIDHACVWNRILTAGEISGLMETPMAGGGGSGAQRQKQFFNLGLGL